MVNYGDIIGQQVGGLIAGILKGIMIALGVGIAVCGFLDILLTYARDTIFDVTPDAYDSGFLTKTSVALTMALVPYLIYLCIFIFMLMPTMLMFMLTGFQNWVWLYEWDPPNFIDNTLAIIETLLDLFGVGTGPDIPTDPL